LWPKRLGRKSLVKKAFTHLAQLLIDIMYFFRFDSHGGGWGYSGHSVEAIRFMADMDILLGGFGLFGGRGEYVGKIKLFDIGVDGGDQVCCHFVIFYF